MTSLRRLAPIVILAAGWASAQTTCGDFPKNLIPFSTINYVTAANSSGDQLVVGALANGLNTLAAIPAPAVTNQLFCDSQVQLAAGQFFPNVYVPTAAERNGTFSAFAGLLLNPTTGVAYPGGNIPANQLGQVFAFRIAAVQTSTSSARNWSPTGSMSLARSTHASVRLPAGKVLVAGGALNNAAELFDPATGTFTSAGSSRFSHSGYVTATLLNNGRVLVVGGNAGPGGAELYDPSTNQFSTTGATTLPHVASTATLLNDGRVLLAGGQSGLPNTSTVAAEVYDPSTGTFAPTGPMATDRIFHTATLLPDGRVLIAGGTQYTSSNGANGLSISSAEIFDPAAGKFSVVGSMQAARSFHFAALLPNGKVLLGGGSQATSGTIPGTAAELFDPGTSTFAATGDMSFNRTYAIATLLPNGLVLIEGGLAGGSGNTNTAELYNPSSGTFVTTDSMNVARRQHRATLLLDGRVLVTGGSLIGGSPDFNSAELYTPVTQGLVTSQTGLTFRAAQGAGALPTQTVVVLSPTDTIPYNVAVRTFTGGTWLRATPTGGTAGPTTTPVSLTITADATGLAAQDYYGSVTLSPTDGKHPPVSIAIVLTIVPAGAAAAPGVTPTGLVFTSTGTSPAPRTFVISNVTSKALTFTGVATQATTFFDFSPKTSLITAGQSQTITVTPASGALALGVNRGSIKLSFGDGSSQTVDVLQVVSPAVGTSAIRGAVTPCNPTKLLPVLTSIGAGFSTPLAWPTPIIVQVVDDCGAAINSGSVTASFTNGDLPISLLAIGNGTWSATWVPVRATSNTGVRADARSLQLNGTVQVSGGVAANPKVPVVAPGGVLSSGDYLGSPAQGLLASIFGVALADGALQNSSLPLPQQLGSTIVSISGQQLPVLYVSENQVNVFIPFELAVNSPHQLIVQRANAISVPVPIAIFENQPAILATAGNGQGQGHIYKSNAAGLPVLADASSPAKADDVVVMYAVGLGPVNPSLRSGDPAPLTFLENITGTASVTIGGVPAPVAFAGLTPGFSGLYQLNVTVPAGITAGNQVPVTVAVNGRAGAGSIFMAIQD